MKLFRKQTYMPLAMASGLVVLTMCATPLLPIDKKLLVCMEPKKNYKKNKTRITNKSHCQLF